MPQYAVLDGLGEAAEVVLRAGERLFCETSDKKPMRLVSCRTIGDNLVYLVYERIRDAS